MLASAVAIPAVLAAPFPLSYLFRNGEQGWGYDSDLGYLNSLGPELVTNGDGSTTAGWTAGGSTTLQSVGGALKASGTTDGAFFGQNLGAFSAGQVLVISYDVIADGTSKEAKALLGTSLGNSSISGTAALGFGTNRRLVHTFTADVAACYLWFYPGFFAAANYILIDNVRAKRCTNLSGATMFQDSAGTTPVTEVEQPVGLQLDKRYGLVRGSELVTNGTFDSDTSGWTAEGGATAAQSSGEIVVTNTAAGAAEQARQELISVVSIGKTYELTLTARKGTSTSYSIFVETQAAPLVSLTGLTNTSNENKPAIFTVPSGATQVRVKLRVNGLGTSIFDNVSVKEIPGNHRLQATSASRPTLSARYNLLTKSEQFDHSDWTAFKTAGASVAANTTTAPDGNMTADTVTFAAGTDYIIHQTASSISVVSGNAISFTLHARTATQLAFFGGGGVGAVAGTNTYSYVDIGGGWYRQTVTRTFSASGSGVPQALVYGGTAGAGSYPIWGADLRLSTDVTGKGPAYQRVNTSTDYDTTGFLHYLKYDGVDDSLATASTVDFSATDKVTVFVGVTKLSDAADAMIYELSANAATTNSAFALYGAYPGGGASKVSPLARGTIVAQYLGNLAAPATAVLTQTCDIAGGAQAIRKNSSVDNSLSATLGTGNFGNHIAYFGRRGGSTLPFNGREYSNICVGRAVADTEISRGERYVNNRTGAY